MRAGALLLLLALTLAVQSAEGSPRGLNVIVTFSNLKYDVDLLACPSDRVVSLVPPGVDPHDYELKPEDVNLLKEADIVVSTAHTPFERLIREKVASGEIKAELVEIPKLGLKILTNPATKQPNYHMPIYDPDNYLKLMGRLSEIMARENPECASQYMKRYDLIRERILKIKKEAPHLNLSAVAVSPVAQYAVEWAGVKVRYLLLKERGVPATPPELAEIRRKALSGEIGVMVLVGNAQTPLNKKAVEMAEETGISWINIPSPLEPRSTPEKLEDVVKALSNVGENRSTEIEYEYVPMAVTLVVIITSLFTALYLLRRQGREARGNLIR
ncbi:MAG: zinc ABC transporter substrate-binding protein [Candidatus Korarchaeota archaeon]|nr:zinc ABC transporter substrate-binding protein [Candidatus Korarchaeota archaeon]